MSLKKIYLGAFIVVAACFCADSKEADSIAGLDSLSLAQLEERLVSVDSELESLANFSMRSSIGSIGYRAPVSATAETESDWVQIELARSSRIDQVVIVPSVRRGANEALRADGFPLEFRVVAGDGNSTNFVASFTAADAVLPRIAPLVVNAGSVTASWVRVEATVLTPRGFDGMYNFELAEIMVFSGDDNVALRQPVHTSVEDRVEFGARKKEYLVDGCVPYLMDAAQGAQSVAFVSRIGIGEKPELTVDLGAVHSINRVHLHAIDLSDSIPQSTPSGFGMPRHLIIEGAKRADFSDTVRLVDYKVGTVYDTGPIIMHRFPETACRYVRLTALKPYIDTGRLGSGSRIGFAEIEIFAGDRNVALDKAVTANFELISPSRSFTALTDGRNLYGNILPVRQWLNELARRHDLERIRPAITAELNRRYARQKRYLSLVSWLAVLLGVGIVLAFLVERLVHLRELSRIREQYAADLHDELGANLHTIGMLGDLALSSADNSEQLKSVLRHSREITEKTGVAVRHCMDMQSVYGRKGGLKSDIERISERILADMKYEVCIKGEKFLINLTPRKRTGLFLFYKESLINVSRHSNAECVTVKLSADRRKVILSVCDDGCGLPAEMNGGVPLSLRRRARLMGAKVQVDSLPGEGTSVTLRMRTRRFF